MFVEYNPNPTSRRVGDCAVRAVAKALDLTWEQAYVLLVTNGFSMGDMPSSDLVWGATSTAIIKVPRECCFSLSVESVAASADTTVVPAPVINVQNANLVISRIA